jgi:hypothetical protein
MSVAMLDSHGNYVEPHLGKKSGQDQHANAELSMRVRGGTALNVIQLGDEVEHGQAKQVGSGESIEELDMFWLVQLENQNAQSSQNNAGE